MEFLINSRSRAVLDLIDAFELTESELVDIRDGVYNRVSELRNNLNVGDVTCECYRCKGLGAIHMTDDTADDTCPVCDGSGELICDEGEPDDIDNSIVGAMMRGRRSLQDGIDPFEDDDEPIIDEDDVCPKCNGEGRVTIIEDGLEMECDECDGAGY